MGRIDIYKSMSLHFWGVKGDSWFQRVRDLLTSSFVVWSKLGKRTFGPTDRTLRAAKLKVKHLSQYGSGKRTVFLIESQWIKWWIANGVKNIISVVNVTTKTQKEIQTFGQSFKSKRLFNAKDLTKYKVRSVALSHFYASFPTYVAFFAPFRRTGRLSLPTKRKSYAFSQKWAKWQN